MNKDEGRESMKRHITARFPGGHQMPVGMVEMHALRDELHELHKLAHDRVSWRGGHVHKMVFEVGP